tara:strand:+ start:94 stop:465 length:372 start_codon:yes stop_codon:yes gene_type:complete
MKKIKLTILGLLLFLFSYGQTDTIRVMINGTNKMIYTDLNNTISTDVYNKKPYKNYIIKLKKENVLILSLYDNCKYCKDSITSRTIEYIGRITNSKYIEKFQSSSNLYYFNGNRIKTVIVKKP